MPSARVKCVIAPPAPRRYKPLLKVPISNEPDGISRSAEAKSFVQTMGCSGSTQWPDFHFPIRRSRTTHHPPSLAESTRSYLLVELSSSSNRNGVKVPTPRLPIAPLDTTQSLRFLARAIQAGQPFSGSSGFPLCPSRNR